MSSRYLTTRMQYLVGAIPTQSTLVMTPQDEKEIDDKLAESDVLVKEIKELEEKISQLRQQLGEIVNQIFQIMGI